MYNFAIFIHSLISQLTTFSKDTFVRLRQIANATLNRLSIQAYYLWSNRNIFATYGIRYRSGSATGKSAILLVVYIVVAFLVATILFPIAMTQVTSAVTTSWNAEKIKNKILSLRNSIHNLCYTATCSCNHRISITLPRTILV